jgi:two-component system, chemotaxis family, response regulator PixG
MHTPTKTLPQFLLHLSHKQATGELVIASTDKTTAPWKLYVYSGRLIYATGGVHPVRRWYRALSQHVPSFDFGWLRQMKTPSDYWEVDLLNQAIQKDFITVAQAKAVIQSIIQEVLWTLIEHPLAKHQWHANRVVGQQAIFLAIEPLLQEAQVAHEQFMSLKVQQVLPNLALEQMPSLAPFMYNETALQAHISANAYKRIAHWMQGNYTFWDIAVQTRRPLVDIIRLFLPFIRQELVGLKNIPDLAAPYRPRSVSQAAPKKVSKGLIACIDDSPTVSQVMAKILHPLGYEVLPIMKPLQEISNLINHKPDLIFLDLIMPNINGYELCNFLRKTSTFQDTPIVILTGRDGMIDRMRTKFAGCTDFLAKPPNREKVIQMVEKYLPTTQLDLV